MMIDTNRNALPWKWIGIAWISVLLLPFLLSLFGLSNIELGGKGMVEGAFLNTAIRSFICLVLIAFVFVGPYTQFIHPHFIDRTEVERVLSAVFFLGMPLFSYAYYEGTVKSAMDFHELSLVVLSSVVLASVLFERTEKIWIFAVTLGVSFLYSLYFLNDLMAPFATLFNTIAKSEWLYFWRTIGLTFIVWIITACVPKQKISDKKKEIQAVVAFLALVWVFLEFILPVLMKAAIHDVKLPSSHQWEWTLLFALFIFLFAKKEVRELAALALSATLLVASSYSLVDFMRSYEVDFWKLTWAAFHLSVWITCAKVFVLMRASAMDLKPLFRMKRSPV